MKKYNAFAFVALIFASTYLNAWWFTKETRIQQYQKLAVKTWKEHKGLTLGALGFLSYMVWNAYSKYQQGWDKALDKAFTLEKDEFDATWGCRELYGTYETPTTSEQIKDSATKLAHAGETVLTAAADSLDEAADSLAESAEKGWNTVTKGGRNAKRKAQQKFNQVKQESLQGFADIANAASGAAVNAAGKKK